MAGFPARIQLAKRGREAREAREKAPIDLVMEMFRGPAEASLPERLLGPGGPIAAALPGYRVRQGQIDVSNLIWDTLCDGDRAAIEAPTGIGKTHAALAPGCIWAVTHNYDEPESAEDVPPPMEPLVYSVSQVALQDQIITKDLPFLHGALGVEFRSSYMKGRAWWACPRDLHGAVHPDGKFMRWLATEQGQNGDIGLAPFDISDEMRQAITTEAEDCSGSNCLCFSECFYFRARARAKNAHVVVVNHALLVLNALCGGILFGQPGAIIVDEAHKLEEAARGALSSVVTAEEVFRAIKGAKWGGFVDDEELSACTQAARALEKEVRTCFGDLKEKHRITDTTLAKELLKKVVALRKKLEVVLLAIQDALRYPGSADHAAQMLPSVQLLYSNLSAFEHGNLANLVVWVEKPTPRSRPELHFAPLSVADWLRDNLWKRLPAVLMSATMISTEEAGFSTVTTALGFDDANEMVAPPAFNPTEAARIILPRWRITKPPRDTVAWCKELEGPMVGMLHVTDARSFCLFTAERTMKEMAQRIRKVAPRHWKVLVQGEGSKQELLREYRAATHPVLLGLRTFWEGVDIPGRQISAVHVDQLPFAAPGDPLQDALKELAGGKAAFMTWDIPRAILELRQAFGRLLRKETCRGLFILHDPRLRHSNYRSAILQAIPGWVEPLEASQFELIPGWLDGVGPAPRYNIGF